MKKGHGELQYVIFLSVFIGFMIVLSSIFPANPILKKESYSVFGDLIQMLGLTDIPVLGPFLNLIDSGFTFLWVHPYIAVIFGSLIAVPVGYLVIRLIRGGG